MTFDAGVDTLARADTKASLDATVDCLREAHPVVKAVARKLILPLYQTVRCITPTLFYFLCFYSFFSCVYVILHSCYLLITSYVPLWSHPDIFLICFLFISKLTLVSFPYFAPAFFNRYPCPLSLWSLLS